MTRKEIVVTVDDIDGTPGARLTRFSLDGKHYEIDLCPDNRDVLDAALAPYVAAARRVPSPPDMPRRPGGTDRDLNFRIRDWATANNIPIRPRGRIPVEVSLRYHQAQQTAARRAG